ncbi:OmpA family protein [Rhodococcus sp. HNM0569]|uniref:OmpA family protein n=1 Tax=Rhodococcus sp. HNM0569 TaxID=2716340 RepID=UPI00146C7256|nr:OmpA family protein [Rhodococcus sp. HNM0569]NLU83828.1 OmpA family protein [Rhodococcus sp. HNM0569]
MTRRTTLRKTAVASVAAVSIALAGAACSDDSGNDSGNGGEATSQEQNHDEHSTEGAKSSIESATDSAGDSVRDGVNSVIEKTPVTFDAGSAELGTMQDVTLTAVATALKTGDDKVEIKTYASGDDADALAQARGDAVKGKLVDEGVAEDRLTVTAQGDPDSPDVDVDKVEFVVGGEG